ncbi:porin family protein [Bradyrhizobium sp. KB893862 SZCCT0404]|uniref:outer membrane protein n=1 Tax=Bradyrhizobium sp. KB893862 SZCCT0404 TaxID=2807672 RepID=UPI001BACC209|nr:outer membrane beta-barrel protein [Bradyrhizobium sp. KB893862 SZCCT0404]MBR1179689.1 porin family protein [Bradyrhizobium sp. KB893862 SZCCT0404]
MVKNALRAAAISVSVLMAGTASAADMAVKARSVPAPVPAFSWGGCYVGGNAGYSRAEVRSDGTPNAIFTGTAPAGTAAILTSASAAKVTPDGFTAGLGIGCNYQRGIFVIGAEGDINYSDLGAQQIRGPFANAAPVVPYTWEERFHSNWFATARARAGVVLAERSLLYVTGGAAFAEYNWLKALDFPGFAGFRYQASASESKLGWVVGAGWEYAFNNSWSAKVEYLHMDFGSSSGIAPTPPGPAAGPGAGSAWSISNNFREDVVRLGVNYRFSGGAIVAKY